MSKILYKILISMFIYLKRVFLEYVIKSLFQNITISVFIP